ncbi:MAG: L-aspartate oxidase, partial [Hyphomonadaceae bacterium]
HMHADVGVVRDAAGLNRTLDWIVGATARDGASHALTASRLIVSAALARRESRGGHYRSDFPETLAPTRTFIRQGAEGSPLITHQPPDSTAESAA